jgi:folate-binding protein YgfZ
LLSVQGPKAEAVVRSLGLFTEIPNAPLNFVKVADVTLGEIYLMNHLRLDRGQLGGAGSPLPAAELRDDDGAQRTARPTSDLAGFDLFVPTNSLGVVVNKLIAAAEGVGGRACGWTAFETARIEAGVPRFGADMDETNIPLECGIEARAVSYNKGCYIGQEVINRIHTIGHVNRELRGLRLADDLKTLPARGDKLFKDGKEVGYVTSVVASPTLKANIALGYVRREANAVGTELKLRTGSGESVASIVELPFAK